MFHGRLNAFFLYWLPWYAYLGLIFWFSSLSSPEETLGVTIKDYLLHPPEYFILTLLTFRAFQTSAQSLLKDHIFTSGILFSLLYAASDEWHQTFIPGRTGNAVDLLYDAAGIATGAVLYYWSVLRKSDGSVPA